MAGSPPTAGLSKMDETKRKLKQKQATTIGGKLPVGLGGVK